MTSKIKSVSNSVTWKIEAETKTYNEAKESIKRAVESGDFRPEFIAAYAETMMKAEAELSHWNEVKSMIEFIAE
ncbi:hypothetical protein LJC33_06590 [Eubacteriales bacterium OttesenSCG-928-N13]|nr:hypothetical protein [Eubacteriales bacterium OttesenSCG-928-N13]